MITRIEAARYRCFESLGVDTGPYQVVVGENGAGKTTFLDIPVLLGDLLQQRQISDAFLRARSSMGPRAFSLDELVYFGRGQDFILALEALLPADIASNLNRGRSAARVVTHIRYEVRLRIDDHRRLVVDSEYLFAFADTEAYRANRIPMQGEQADDEGFMYILRRTRARKDDSTAIFTRESSRHSTPGVKVEDSLLALTRVLFESADEFPAARWLYRFLVSDVLFFAPTWNHLRAPSPPGAELMVTNQGENLPWVALTLQEADPERFADWVAHVGDALGISAIDVREREEDHHAYFIVTYHTGLGATSSSLSEGTLRLMAHTLLAYMQAPPHIVLVEEPENGIHPRAIEVALQSLQSMYDSQVWVASHSPVVLAHSALDQILCARMSRSGAAEMIRGSEHPRLREWQGSLDLGTLFAAGVLG